MLILVTGGAGYVGSVLVPMLLDAGHRVRVLDRLDAGGQGLLACCGARGFDFRRGDVCDEEVVEQALDGVDAVVHLAAIVGYPACLRDPGGAQRVNVGSTRLLLKARQPHQRIVLASTGSVYGTAESIGCTELTRPQPVSLYATSKLRAELLTLEAGNATVLRFATAFGVSPRMRFDLLVNDFVRQAIRYRTVTVYEHAFRRTFVHVRDIARSIVFALDHGDRATGEVFNVGDERMNITKGELAELVRRAVDHHVRHEAIGHGHDADRRDHEVDYTKIRSAGFATTVGLAEGIREVITAVQLACADPVGAP